MGFALFWRSPLIYEEYFMNCENGNSNMHRPNISFAGLTAAGKTTHAKLLANSLGYKYVSATEILLEVAGLSDMDASRAWFDGLEMIQNLRIGDKIDDELESRLIKMVSKEDGLVIDSWALPWLYKEPMIRLWIESDRLSRSWKCFVSQGNESSKNLVECAHLMDKKDDSTRDIFLRRHQFDLYRSRQIFDAVLSNTHLIDAPSRSAADKGIEAFDVVVQDVVQHLLSANIKDAKNKDIEFDIKGYGDSIISLNGSVFAPE